MKEKNKYYLQDIINIIIYYVVFAFIFVGFIFGIIKFSKNEIELINLIYRILLVILMCLPYAIKKIFKITFSRFVSCVYYLFIFLSGFLGIILNFYSRYAGWEIFINFISSLIISIFSIYILNYTVYKKDKNKHNLFFTFLFMISFSLAVKCVYTLIECSIYYAVYTKTLTALFIPTVYFKSIVLNLCMSLLGSISGVLFTYIAIQLNSKFLKTFKIKKLKKLEQEIENIEE